MKPTHKHAKGGLYRLVATGVSGKAPQGDYEGDWMEGVLYQDVLTGVKYWTTTERFAKRFEEIPSTDQVAQRVNLWDDETVIASFTFDRTGVGDICHMLIKGEAPRDTAIPQDVYAHVKRVLGVQAEMISNGLYDVHDRIDFLGDVIAFHRKFRQQKEGDTHLLPQALFEFRQKFHIEETEEYRDNGHKIYEVLDRPDFGPDVAKSDRKELIHLLAEQLDAICDAVWVLLGTVDLQFDRETFYAAWKRVVTANMSKVLATDDPNAQDSGRDVKYDIRKPEGWQAPDHRDLIKV